MWNLSQVSDVTKAVDTLTGSFGMAAFGLVSVIVLVVLGMVVYTKIFQPMQDTARQIEAERTKQSEALKETAQSLERSQREVSTTAAVQKSTLDGMERLAGQIGCKLMPGAQPAIQPGRQAS